MCFKMLMLKYFFVVLVWFAAYVLAECPPIIRRDEWDGVKPKHVQYLNTPVDLVIIQHTVTQSCSNDKSCAETVRDIQKTHTEQSFLWDIGPSFLIGGNGKIYEGRGWNRVAFHTTGYNNQSIGIAFIGKFNNQEPSPKALESAKSLIKCGIDEERLTADHNVVVHRQLIPTESPGKKLVNKVMTWPDWKEDVSEIKKRADIQDNKRNEKEKEVDKTEKDNSDPEADTDIPDSISSRYSNEVLTKPKEVDQLANLRDVIAELINSLRNVATEVLRTIEFLARSLAEQLDLFFTTLASSLRKHKELINAAANRISNIPGLGKCVNPLKEKASNLYDKTEANAKNCAQKRVKDVDDMIKNLSDLSHKAIEHSNIAVDNTKNCTELNFGIVPSTRACLNSVTKQVQSATEIFESQRAIALNAIQTALKTLPAALDLCSKKSLMEASSQSNNIIMEITNCKPSIPLLSNFGSW